jgi:lipopolysaccharide/colanic/teichoic acid biosynthesis glycosyltransferase
MMKSDAAHRRDRCAALAVKRAIDVVGALAGLTLLAPVLLAGMVAVRLTMGRPVLFRQTRPGRHERPFVLWKLRTMTDARDAAGRLLPDAARQTRVGRLLRATSVDELPELVNVLRGDMSLVGPRPLLTEYVLRYTPEQRRRHAVRPGITGLAQVNGRQELVFSRRLRLDVWYVDHWSLWLDLWILARTVKVVCGPSGAVLGESVEGVDDVGLCDPSRVTPRRAG